MPFAIVDPRAIRYEGLAKDDFKPDAAAAWRAGGMGFL